MKRSVTIATVILVFVSASSFLVPARVMAQIPRLISYQGVLTDTLGHPKPDGTYTFTFELYRVSSGGTALWNETKSLSTHGGLFATMLGDQTTFPDSVRFDNPYWLSVQVGSEVLSPRIQLGAVGYSLNSMHAFRSDTARFAINTGATFAPNDTLEVSFNSITAPIGNPANIASGLTLKNISPSVLSGAQNSPAIALTQYSWNPTANASQENSWYIHNWGFSTSGTTGGVLTFTVRKPSDPLTISPFAIDEGGRTLLGYTKAHLPGYSGFWGEDFGQWSCILAGKTVVGWPENNVTSDLRVTGNTTMDGFLGSSLNGGSARFGEGDSVEVSITGLTGSAGAVATFAEAPATNNPIYTATIQNGKLTFKSGGNNGKKFWYWIVNQ